MLECKVEGQDCGEGFAFKVFTTKEDDDDTCETENGKCKKTSDTERNKLCSGAATVAALSEDEINLVCKSSKDSYICPKCKKKLRLRAQHLSEKMCVKSIEGFWMVANMEIEAGACERDADGKLQQYMLELSFALEE